jgi:hypothetical protein
MCLFAAGITPMHAGEGNPEHQRAILERQIAKQETRVASCQAGIDAGNAEAEASLRQIVRMAETIRDSRQSGTKAVQIKDEVAHSLADIIRFYQAEIDRIRENQRRERTREAKNMWEEQIAKGNAMIEKRVEEILRVTKSLASYADGAYRHNPRTTTSAARRADRLTNEVADGIAKSIRGMEKENEQLSRELDRTRSGGQRARLKRRIETNEFLIDRRREQLVETKVGRAGGQRTVNRSAARDIDQQIRDMFRDLRDLYTALLEQKRNADAEKRKLALLQDRLEKFGTNGR